MNKYKIFVSQSANNRMYAHFEFLAKVSKNAANNLLNRLLSDIQSLEYMPQKNPYFIQPFIEQRKYRYKLSYRRYRIVYQIIKDNVYVEDIQDCRQDIDKNLIS